VRTRRINDPVSPHDEAHTRRTVVRRVGAGALGLTLAAHRFNTRAQEATLAADALPPAVQAYVAALETADAELIATTYEADAVLIEPAFGGSFTGLRWRSRRTMPPSMARSLISR
jgi:hypothetical protein